MASITYWSRLEPRPRTRSIANSLAARVRDPLWILTRQWQFGEFRAEDRASPAIAQLAVRLGRLESWSAGGGDAQPLPAQAPLEAVALAEDFNQADPSLPVELNQITDLSLAAELGQVFEQALVDLGRSDLITIFREAYPLKEDEEHLDSRDHAALRFLLVTAGRGTHGGKLFLAAEIASPDLPAEPAIAPADEPDVREALERLRAWVRDTIGSIGQSDASAWNPARLEYDLEVMGKSPTGGDVMLSAHPDREGRCGWYAFDVHKLSSPGEGTEEGIDVMRRSVIPANASFRGMPNPRWWAFESGTMNLSAVRIEKRELAKLVVLDFMLVHSNDWYVVPFRQPLGTLCHVDSLVIHDVFGGTTLIERADRHSSAVGQRWTLFSTSVVGAVPTADFFVLPPTVGTTAQSSEAVEEVRFIRDEMANMAWGIEHIVENGIGEPWPAHERSLTGLEAEAFPPTSSEDEPALRYQIHTSVPEHWFPFLPVAIDPSRRDIQYERGVLLRSDEASPPEPAGRILRPTQFLETRYQLREEEIPRVGLRVMRSINRSRWADGSTHVWTARRKTFAAHEEHSGLLFDLAVFRGQET